MTNGTLDPKRIEAALRTERVGRRIEHLESAPSTNDEAWRRADAPDADGLVVFAEHQTSGRGRFGRVWHSPRGASVLCSTLLLDRQGVWNGGELGLVAAVAACDALAGTAGVPPTIKWPNDLTVGGRKLGGILIESRIRHDGVRAFVLGIGINCLQHRGHLESTLGDLATSLDLESAGPVDRTAVAVALLSELDHWLARDTPLDQERLREMWLARSDATGRRVQLQNAGRTFAGSIIDIDPHAALVVRLDDGNVRAFDVATTTMLPAQGTTDSADTR
jgi:BirA family biotin operon repressor/biotin-[acetyl-CoA-carboxylase] ligase